LSKKYVTVGDFLTALFLAFKLLAKEAGSCLDQLCFKLRRDLSVIVPCAKRCNASCNVALGDNWHKTAYGISAVNNADTTGFRGVIKLTVFNERLRFHSDLAVNILTLGEPGARNHNVTVTDHHRETAGLVESLRVLTRKLCHLTNRGILLENDLAFVVCIDLKGVAFADAHGSADLFGNYDTTKVVPLCQVGAKKFNGFFKKLGVTRV